MTYITNKRTKFTSRILKIVKIAIARLETIILINKLPLKTFKCFNLIQKQNKTIVKNWNKVIKRMLTNS
jgi:hypothetical protein